MRVERQPSRASPMLRLDKLIYLGQANNRSDGQRPLRVVPPVRKEHASDAMVLRSRAPRRARIEIIPMIDVVFFLLVFFMMASLAMTVYRGLPVNLPEASSGQRNAAETASITLSRDGGSFLNSEPVTVATLGGRIRPLLAKNRELAVIINADREVTHARVVDVLDELRQTGVGKIAIAVAPAGRASR